MVLNIGPFNACHAQVIDQNLFNSDKRSLTMVCQALRFLEGFSSRSFSTQQNIRPPLEWKGHVRDITSHVALRFIPLSDLISTLHNVMDNGI